MQTTDLQRFGGIKTQTGLCILVLLSGWNSPGCLLIDISLDKSRAEALSFIGPALSSGNPHTFFARCEQVVKYILSFADYHLSL